MAIAVDDWLLKLGKCNGYEVRRVACGVMGEMKGNEAK